MGANTFYDTSSTTNADDAFNELVSESRHLDGVSYSGGIGMKHSFDIVQRTPVAQRKADALAESCLDGSHSDKWGPAAAIAVGKPKATKPRTVTIALQDVADGVSDETIAAAVAAKLDVSSDRINSYEIVGEPAVKFSYNRVAGTSKATRVWAVKEEYVWFTRSQTWRTASTHRTKTEAMAAARKLLQHDASTLTDWRGDPLTFITADQTRRSYAVVEELKLEGEAAGWERTLSSYKAKFNVELGGDDLEFSHWLFVGWASS